MKKWIVVIFSCLILITLLFIINIYKNNIFKNNENNKNINGEAVILNEENVNIDITNESKINSNNDKTLDEEKNNIEEKNENYEEEVNSNIKYNNESSKEETENNNINKKIIVIDPGHQSKGDSSKEPIGPGATETKAKVTTGATGTYTKQRESELVLKVALLLETELKQEGYNVIMTRTTNNINISNQERAMIANNAKADAFIRIHADSYDDPKVNRNVYIVSNIK